MRDDIIYTHTQANQYRFMRDDKTSYINKYIRVIINKYIYYLQYKTSLHFFKIKLQVLHLFQNIIYSKIIYSKIKTEYE